MADDRPQSPEEDPDEIRQIRPPRWILFAAIAAMVLIVGIGALWSNSARDEQVANGGIPTTVTLQPENSNAAGASTTTTTVVRNTAWVTSTTPEKPTTTVANVGVACTDAALLAAVKESGLVAEAIQGDITIDQRKCADGYAYVHMPGGASYGSAEAYLKADTNKWRVLTLGAVAPSDNVPPETLSKIKP